MIAHWGALKRAGRSRLCFLAAIILGASSSRGLLWAAKAELAVPIDVPEPVMVADPNGLVTFSCPDIQCLGQTGEPDIPWHVMTVLLPPDAELETIEVRLENKRFEAMPGEWMVAPVPPVATWREGRQVILWPTGKTIVNGRDADIYRSSAFWPAEDVRLLSTGRLRKWRLVQAAVPVLKYNPAAEQLQKLISGQLIVSFQKESWKAWTINQQSELTDRIGENAVRRLTVNFNDQMPAYEQFGAEAADGERDSAGKEPAYVIITTSAIQSASTKLSDFVAHKQSLGFSVQVITETDFGGDTGDAAAENIRTWLQNHYVSDQIEYVLFIGDQDPADGDVPMKVLWPTIAAYEDTPSDYYYADLTGNWDLDGDGYYGEYSGDFGSGGVDRFWEVHVGRIPYYGAISQLDHILQKTMDYENESEETLSWRKNVLLPMKPSDADTPGYHLGEQIKNDLLAAKGWPYHRIYDDDYGLTPPPETTPCTYDNVRNVWKNGTFGLVVWWAHGGIDWADNVMGSGYAQELNDDYPAFTFQCSCSNAYPEYANNLAYALLKNGGVATVGATRTSWYIVGQGRFDGSPSNAGMAYEYASRIVGARTDSGFALNDLRQEINPNRWEFWKNFVTFNIYGDPALHLLPLQSRRYVKADATPGGDGRSWDTAYSDLQNALSDIPVEIWIAAGTYTPDRGTGDRTYSFQLTNGVAVYGGFAGGETTLFQRDPSNNITILSGDLAGNDGPNFSCNTENSYHVITGKNVDATAVLDGLTIAGGNATGFSTDKNDRGAGLFIEESGSPTIRNCVFRDNWARFGGGMRCNSYSNPTLINCVFSNNVAEQYTSGTGGAMHFTTYCEPILINTVLVGNRAYDTGGGIYYSNSSLTLTNCTLAGNQAYSAGSITSNNSHDPLLVTNCILWGNTRYDYGVGGYVADEIAQIRFCHGLDINYSCLQGWTGALGGVHNIGDDPLMIDPDGPDNALGTTDDDLRLRGNSPCLDAGDNSVIPSWLLTDAKGNPRIQNEVVDMGAYEGPHQAFVLSTETLTIPEGQTDTFTIALAIEPDDVVSVTVARASGDESISVISGASLTFNAGNYSQPQPVTVQASQDDDNLAGSALLWVTADDLPTAGVTVNEVDDDPVNNVLYVDRDAPGLNNGANWAGAYTDLQFALTLAAEHPNVEEIRIAEGTYTPAEPAGDRRISFELVDGLAVRGAYAGFGELDPDARNLIEHETILSGDLNGNDGPNYANKDENTHHVIYFHDSNGSVVLDGLTVIGGNANGDSEYRSGAGMYAWGTVHLVNCTFRGNWAQYDGGGVYSYGDSSFVNCEFNGNYAYGCGGGLLNGYHTVPITNCTFYANRACSSSRGGGLYTSSGISTVTNCIFWGNIDYYGQTYQTAQLAGSSNVVEYCCIQSWSSGGTGNTNEDPSFVNALGNDGIAGTADDELNLLTGSPCIDAGNNDAVPLEVTIDRSGGLRRVDNPATDPDPGNGTPPIVDMGAYEFQPATETPPTITHIHQDNGAVRGGVANINPDGTASIEARTKGITICTIEFSENVDIQASNVQIRDLNNTMNLTWPSTFNYNAGTHTLTMEWPAGTFMNIWIRIHVLDTVTSAATGLALDGEIVGLDGDLPSGDGVPGGDAQFVIGALQGDVDGNRIVNSFDRLRVNQNQGSTDDIPSDVDGNGIVNSFDRLRTNQNQGTSLPPP